MDPDGMRIGWSKAKRRRKGVGQHRHLHGPIWMMVVRAAQTFAWTLMMVNWCLEGSTNICMDPETGWRFEVETCIVVTSRMSPSWEFIQIKE